MWAIPISIRLFFSYIVRVAVFRVSVFKLFFQEGERVGMVFTPFRHHLVELRQLVGGDVLKRDFHEEGPGVEPGNAGLLRQAGNAGPLFP